MSTSLRLVCAIVLASAACGDDDTPRAEDYEGTWLISAVTLSDQGQPITLTRDGAPNAFRGDAVFTASGDTTGALDVRQVVLTDGLIASEVMTIPVAVTVEPDRWVLADPGGTSVYRTARSGERLVLTLDPADPRNTNDDPTTEIIVDRVAPWTTTVVGPWRLASITFASGTIDAGVCVEVTPGVAWAKLEMSIVFTDRLLFTRTMTTRVYTDAACTALTTTETATQTGFAEEEGGAALRMWGVGDGEREFLGFAIAAAGSQLTLTRTTCLPQPACTSAAPTAVVVTRAP